MGKYEKLLRRILTGTSDNNIKFDELCQLLRKLDFDERIKGDHYIFTKDNYRRNYLSWCAFAIRIENPQGRTAIFSPEVAKPKGIKSDKLETSL